VLGRYRRAFRDGLETGRLEATADGVRIPPRHRFVADDIIAWLMAAADGPAPCRTAARDAPPAAPAFDRLATASVT